VPIAASGVGQCASCAVFNFSAVHDVTRRTSVHVPAGLFGQPFLLSLRRRLPCRFRHCVSTLIAVGVPTSGARSSATARAVWRSAFRCWVSTWVGRTRSRVPGYRSSTGRISLSVNTCTGHQQSSGTHDRDLHEVLRPRANRIEARRQRRATALWPPLQVITAQARFRFCQAVSDQSCSSTPSFGRSSSPWWTMRPCRNGRRALKVCPAALFWAWATHSFAGTGFGSPG
jgi:hypothetical protein